MSLRPDSTPLSQLDGVRCAGQVTWDPRLTRFRVDVTDGTGWLTSFTASHAAAVALLRATVVSLDTGVHVNDGRWTRSVPVRPLKVG